MYDSGYWRNILVYNKIRHILAASLNILDIFNFLIILEVLIIFPEIEIKKDLPKGRSFYRIG